MLGYRVTVQRLTHNAIPDGVQRERARPYREANFNSLGAEQLASFYTLGSGMFDLLDLANAGGAELVHDGGYPYVVIATAADIRTALADIGQTVPPQVPDDEKLLVIGWDQS